MTERGLESPYADRLRDWQQDPEHAARLTTRVPCAGYFHIRDHALLAHATKSTPKVHGSQCRWRFTKPSGQPRTGSCPDAGGDRATGGRPVRRHRG